MADQEELVQLWAEALRSGEYKQGKSVLHNRGENAYCCLGVACRVYELQGGTVPIGEDVKYWGVLSGLPATVRDAFGLTSNLGQYDESDCFGTLAHRNDHGTTFAAIANMIEQRVGTLFVKEEAHA